MAPHRVANRATRYNGAMSQAVPTEHVVYEPHVGDSRAYMRDIILGVNDGLVSIFLLVAGVVGGGLDRSTILLAAIAAGIAGAVSMGAGEYMATRSQEEVFDREIALEREHIKHFRDDEVAQLHDMFTDMGVTTEDMDGVVAAFSRNDEVLLNSMKALEFGIVDTERRSPLTAMMLSGLMFLAGALPPTLPFFFTSDPAFGLFLAAVLTGGGLFAVGAAKTLITRAKPVPAGFRNLVIAGLGSLAAFYIGGLVADALA